MMISTSTLWIAAPGLASTGVFGARRNSLTGPFGRLDGTGKGSAAPEHERAPDRGAGTGAFEGGSVTEKPNEQVHPRNI